MLAASPSRTSPQRLRRKLQPVVAEAAAVPGMDRYRKAFPAIAHLWILLLHVLEGSPSLRQIHARLRLRERLWSAWGMTRFISRCQLTRSSTSRPADGAVHLWQTLVAQAYGRPVKDLSLRTLLLHEAIDSTFLRLSEKLAPWSKHGQAVAGQVVQCGYDLAREIPVWLAMHGREANDREALRQRDLSGLAGWTVILDKGYYAHKRLAALLAADVDFITRRYDPATVEILRSYAVTHVPLGMGERLVGDHLIDLGSPNNRASTVVRGVRLIQYETPDGELHEVLTSRFDLTAGDLIQLYRKRWQIELFFRFLKRQLGMIRPFGYSRQALWLTVVIVAAVAVLLALLEPLRPVDESRVAWAKAVATVLTEEFDVLRL
jgi:hypothetical protein